MPLKMQSVNFKQTMKTICRIGLALSTYNLQLINYRIVQDVIKDMKNMYKIHKATNEVMKDKSHVELNNIQQGNYQIINLPEHNINAKYKDVSENNEKSNKCGTNFKPKSQKLDERRDQSTRVRFLA